MNRLHHRGGGHHIGRTPAVAVAHIHVFDQAQFQAALAGQGRQGQQLILVSASLDHRVELQSARGWIKTGAARMLDRLQHQLEGSPASSLIRQARHCCHAGRAAAIQAQGEAIQASTAQALGAFGVQEQAVARERNLSQALLPQRLAGADQALKLGMQQRFTAREPQAVSPQAYRRRDQLQPLVQVQEPGRFLPIR